MDSVEDVVVVFGLWVAACVFDDVWSFARCLDGFHVASCSALKTLLSEFHVCDALPWIDLWQGLLRSKINWR